MNLAATQLPVTLDFHLTCECNQECPYCWGPQGIEHPVDTGTAFRIVDRVKQVGARRIVFTGGDPLKRADAGPLVRHAKGLGLEVALSTTGDELTLEFLEAFAPFIDLISLPLDGASEQVNARTKKAGHFAAVLQALDWLRNYPQVDVKLCTPVTLHNLHDVPNLVRLAEAYARTTRARFFYNIFQAFPRSVEPRDWEQLLVSAGQFAALREQLAATSTIRLNFLDQATLDRLYVMIFPDGSLVIPCGAEYQGFGPFLEIEDLAAAIASSRFDAIRHLSHSRAWQKETASQQEAGPPP